MTDSDLTTLLDRLLALPAETELHEFKTAGTSFGLEDLGKYFSALSNEANLHRQDQAWLVCGVDDQRRVVGTQYRPYRPGLDSLKGEIAARRATTSPSSRFVYHRLRAETLLPKRYCHGAQQASDQSLK